MPFYHKTTAFSHTFSDGAGRKSKIWLVLQWAHSLSTQFWAVVTQPAFFVAKKAVLSLISSLCGAAINHQQKSSAMQNDIYFLDNLNIQNSGKKKKSYTNTECFRSGISALWRPWGNLETELSETLENKQTNKTSISKDQPVLIPSRFRWPYTSLSRDV